MKITINKVMLSYSSIISFSITSTSYSNDRIYNLFACSLSHATLKSSLSLWTKAVLHFGDTQDWPNPNPPPPPSLQNPKWKNLQNTLLTLTNILEEIHLKLRHLTRMYCPYNNLQKSPKPIYKLRICLWRINQSTKHAVAILPPGNSIKWKCIRGQTISILKIKKYHKKATY